MGVCGSDLLEKLGPEFGKLVACQKGKEFIDQKVQEIKAKFYEESDHVKKEVLTKIQEQQKNLLNKVKSTVAEIDKTSPQSLDQAAALRRQSKEDLLGGAQIKKKFQAIRETVSTKLKEEEKNILAAIDHEALTQKQNLDDQRPKIPIYDSLPPSQKTKVFAEGEKRFAESIRNQQEALQKQLEQKLDIKKYTKALQGHDGNLDEMAKEAHGIIESAQSGLKATSLFC